jgi:hypothetical protein
MTRASRRPASANKLATSVSLSSPDRVKTFTGIAVKEDFMP